MKEKRDLKYLIFKIFLTLIVVVILSAWTGASYIFSAGHCFRSSDLGFHECEIRFKGITYTSIRSHFERYQLYCNASSSLYRTTSFRFPGGIMSLPASIIQGVWTVPYYDEDMLLQNDNSDGHAKEECAKTMYDHYLNHK